MFFSLFFNLCKINILKQLLYVIVPEAPPIDVIARPINSTSVQVWWKPPDPQKINGINQGYKLQAWIGNCLLMFNIFNVLIFQTNIFFILRLKTFYFYGTIKMFLYA